MSVGVKKKLPQAPNLISKKLDVPSGEMHAFQGRVGKASASFSAFQAKCWRTNFHFFFVLPQLCMTIPKYHYAITTSIWVGIFDKWWIWIATYDYFKLKLKKTALSRSDWRNFSAFSKFSIYKHLDLFSVVELVCNAFKWCHDNIISWTVSLFTRVFSVNFPPVRLMLS